MTRSDYFFSFDDVWAKGATTYQQRWDGADAKLGECLASADRVRGEVSASYLDYPKAAERAAQLLPSAKIVVLLREPVSRLVSSFNMKWQVETCGKLTWTRRDCHLGITSRAIVRDNAVGPFQKNAALKVWSKCNRNEKSLDESCLRDDYVAKLRNRTNAEIKELKECHRTMPTESLGKCLGVNILAQRKLYKKMEDAAFVYRSMYHEHLQHWLKFYAPAQLLVLASESFFEPTTIKPTMQRFARFLGLADAGTPTGHLLEQGLRRARASTHVGPSAA